MENEILLKIDNLKKNYDNITALEDINLEVHKGEVLVILGPSGCGKSTFLRCLNGLEEIKEGNITFGNKGIIGKDVKWEEVRGEIGMVFQSYELFPHMNVIDNILLGPMKAQKRDKKEVEKQGRRAFKKNRTIR